MLEPGALIQDKYKIVRLLGQGGMGAVYEAENLRIRRRVAIKVLKPEVSSDDESVRRFEHEAQAAGQIGSDHILEILDLGVMPDGARFMVMEYLDGEPLSARIQRLGRMAPAVLAPILRQILEALEATHAAGIVHRDLKPDNVFVLREKAGHPDFVKLIDFGISKFQSQGPGALSMTRSGMVMGTPLYMSPEQAKGARDIDARADLYAVGLIAYEAVTGRLPFDVETFQELIMKIAFEDPPHPQSLVPELDPGFCAILLKAMSRDREQRYATAAAMLGALDAWKTRAAGSVEVTAPMEQPELHRTPAPNASWAASQPIATGTPRSQKTLIIAASGGVALLGAIGLIGALVLNKGGTEVDAEPSAQTSASGSPVATSTQPAADPGPAATQEEPAPEPSAAPSASSAKAKRVQQLPAAKPSATAKPRDFGY